jgi:hypothetical protein
MCELFFVAEQSVNCVTAAALADDARSMLEGASGIAAPEVVAHFAENLRNTGSALHAK